MSPQQAVKYSTYPPRYLSAEEWAQRNGFVWGWLQIERRYACWLMTATGTIYSAWVEGPERMPKAITERVPYLPADELSAAWEAMWRGLPPPEKSNEEARKALAEWCEMVDHVNRLNTAGEKPNANLLMQLVNEFALHYEKL